MSEHPPDAPFPEEPDEFNRYRIGLTQTAYNPAEQEIREMLHLVAYDVTDPKRLRLVAKTCKDYGARVEKSVFECDLDAKTFQTMWEEINRLIDPESDTLLAYRLCRRCVRETLSAGTVVRPGAVLVYLP